MKKTDQQSQEPVQQDLAFQDRGPLSDDIQEYMNFSLHAQSDEAKLARKLARIKRNQALFEDTGTRMFPARIPLARIRAESQKAMAQFRQELEEKRKEHKSGFFPGDFIELIKNYHGEITGRRPKSTGELAYMPYFDWRLTGIVARPRDQGECGSCWAHVAVEAFESRLMYNVNRVRVFAGHDSGPVIQIALSVQGVLDCVIEGNCEDGGSHTEAFNHFVKNGARLLAFDADGAPIDDLTAPTDKKGHCKEEGGKGIRALTWDFAIPRNPLLVPKSRAAIRCVKTAMLNYGPLAVNVTMDPESRFRNYREENYKRGVYDVDCQLTTNHFVLLTGWDDERDAWIILNSFGRDWGGSCVDIAKVRKLFPWTIDNVKHFLKPDKGCMYIKYGVSNIGQMAAWIETHLDNKEWIDKAKRKFRLQKARALAEIDRIIARRRASMDESSS